MNNENRRCMDCKHFTIDLGWSGFGGEYHLGSIDCERNHGYGIAAGVDDNRRVASTTRMHRMFVRQAETCADFEELPDAGVTKPANEKVT